MVTVKMRPSLAEGGARIGAGASTSQTFLPSFSSRAISLAKGVVTKTLPS